MSCNSLCRHLAAAEGQLAAVDWLLKNNCGANPIDRFSRTPLDVSPFPISPANSLHGKASWAATKSHWQGPSGGICNKQGPYKKTIPVGCPESLCIHTRCRTRSLAAMRRCKSCCTSTVGGRFGHWPPTLKQQRPWLRGTCATPSQRFCFLRPSATSSACRCCAMRTE